MLPHFSQCPSVNPFISSFRSLVLNFPPPEEVDKIADDRRRKIVEFMLELRKLFAFMVGSQRYGVIICPWSVLKLIFTNVGNMLTHQERWIFYADT